MASILERFVDYLTKPLLPHVAFQVSPDYLSGIYVSTRDRKIKHRFISPLKAEVIQPSFNKKNVLDDAYLEERIQEGAEKLHISKNRIICLIPESCCKIFVFSFTSFPSAKKEREEIISWQVKKQMPLLPDDVRLSSTVLESNKHVKVLVSLARSSVVQEYEEFFSRAGLRVRIVGTPTLSLLNLLDKEDKRNLVILNLEENYICLVAVVEREVVLYRLKPLVLENSRKITVSEKMDYVVTEVENTINFVQDKEKTRMNTLWVRLATADPVKEVFSALRERLEVPVEGLDTFLPSELSFREKQILSPLAGNIL